MRKYTFVLFLLVTIATPIHAQTGYTPDKLPDWTCDSMKVSSRWGWHDPSIVPAGYDSEFSFLTFESIPTKPYRLFLFEMISGENNQDYTGDTISFVGYSRDNPTTTFFSGQFVNYDYYYAVGNPLTLFNDPDTAVYVKIDAEESVFDDMNFYACYLASEVATPTPEPTITPTATATPTATTPPVTVENCYNEDANFTDGFHYNFTVPTGTTSAVYKFRAWGNVQIKITDPNNNTQTVSLFTAVTRDFNIEITPPTPGTWYIEYTGSPASYTYGAEVNLCVESQVQPTPTPGPATPTATPAPTSTATPEPDEPTPGPPHLPDATATPATWPTASVSTPAPAPTPAGCPQSDPYCGNYFYPIDGTLAEFDMSYEATYCVQFIPEISIIDYNGLELCLDTYNFTVSLFDIDIPIVLIFTVMSLLIIYSIIRS